MDKIKMATVETSLRKRGHQTTVVGGEKIKRAVQMIKPAHIADYAKKNNHNTKDCRFKCKKCTWHTHHFKDCQNRKNNNEVKFSEKYDSTENIFYSCLSTQ